MSKYRSLNWFLTFLYTNNCAKRSSIQPRPKYWQFIQCTPESKFQVYNSEKNVAQVGRYWIECTMIWVRGIRYKILYPNIWTPIKCIRYINNWATPILQHRCVTLLPYWQLHCSVRRHDRLHCSNEWRHCWWDNCIQQTSKGSPCSTGPGNSDTMRQRSCLCHRAVKCHFFIAVSIIPLANSHSVTFCAWGW